MGQSRRGSWIETCLNTAIGYAINFTAQIAVFPFFGIHIHIASQLGLGATFTVISIVRGFFVRRMFNHLHVKGVL